MIDFTTLQTFDIPKEAKELQARNNTVSYQNKKLRTALWIVGGMAVIVFIAYAVQKSNYLETEAKENDLKTDNNKSN